jgi:hypothetical protein
MTIYLYDLWLKRNKNNDKRKSDRDS